MNRFTLITTKTRWLSSAMLVLAAGLTGSRSVEAGLSFVSAGGSVTYSVYNTTSVSGSYAFNSSGMLTYSGGGLPALSTQEANSAQTFSTLPNAPVPLSFITSPTTTPPQFGSATTDIYSGYSGQEGGKVTQGGVFWSSATTLSDNIPSGSSQASVSFSTATATYTNFGTSSVTISPGAVMSIAGTLGSSDSFVAAGLSTSIMTSYGGSSTTTALDPIILATNGSVNIAVKGSNSLDSASVTVSGSSVTGYASNLASSMTILGGESITVTSYLTLISDPGSTISITTDLPPGLTNVPDFGSFGAAPQLVPEPSTFVLLASGLGLVGFRFARTRRLRPR